MRFRLNLAGYIKDNQQYIQVLLIKIFIVTLFLPYKVSNVAWMSLLLFWIVNGDFRNSLGGLRRKKILLLFIGFYLLHLVGLLYSDNLFNAYKELEKKIPLLLFPLIIASINDETLKLKRNDLLTFYTKVTAIACGLLVAYAIYRYTIGGNAEVFYFKEFTKVIQVNAIYLAMYVLFAFGVYFYEINTRSEKSELLKKVFIYLATLMVLVFIASKTALTVFILLSLHIAFLQFRHVSRIYRAVIGIVMVLLIAAIINYFPVTKERIQNLMESDWTEVWEEDYTKNAETFTGFTVRVSFWKVTLKQMSEDGVLIHGIGTGDNLDYLNKAYERPGLIAAGYRNFNLHNAFMEVILEFGFAGLLFYLVMWSIVAIAAIQANDKALILLLIIFFIFSMTESVLYVNKGLTFFSLWVSLLLNFIYINRSHTPLSLETR
jgi:O-antigen ligase